MNGIGLGHAIPSFTKAGIVTPSALAELNIHHYEALGVVDPEDRRKLFFLVERIKLSVPQMVEEQHDQEQQELQHHDKELNKIMSSQGASSSSSPNKHPAPRPDPMEDGEDRRHRDVASQPNGKLQQPQPKPQPQQRVARRERGSRKITASPRRTRSMTSQQQTSQKSLRLTNNNNNNNNDEDDDEDEQEDVDDEEDENVENRERDENEIDEEDDEEESVGADDEASSRHRFGVRTHRRATRHRSPIKESVSTTLSSTTTTKMTTPENKSALRKQSTLAETVTTRRRPTSMGPQGTTTTTTTSNDANTDTTMKPGARKSKMQPPRTRRSDIKPSSLISMTRTGKQLSCIPADSIAPASPLVTLPLARLDADIEAQQRMEEQHYKGVVTRKTGASRRSRPLSTMVESGSSESERQRRQRRQSSNASDSEHTHEESSNSESRQTRRISNSSKSLDGSSQLLFNNNPNSNNNNSMEYSARGAKSRPTAASNSMSTTGRSTSLRDLNTTTSGVVKPSNRRSLPGNRHHVVVDNKLTPTASSASGVLFHGGATTNSWASQVAKLRDDNQTEYDLFHADGSSSSGDDESMRIRVVIRKRPMSKTESMAAGEMDIIHPLSYHRYGKILVYQPKTRLDLTKEVETAQFAFDNVFDETSTNALIYQRAVSKLIPGVIQGGQQVSVFAYGQTGSGKSFTMLGSNLTGIVAGTSNDKNAGLYYLAAVDLFQLLPSKQMSVTVSLFEIYGKKLFDLLGDRAVVKCLEDGAGKMQFKGLTEHVIQSAEELLKLIELGAKHRSTGSTSRNADSSRSHAVLQIHLRKHHHQQQHHHYGGSSSSGARHYHGGQHGTCTINGAIVPFEQSILLRFHFSINVLLL